MKNLKYILLGSALAMTFISVIEKLIELIMLWIEVLKIKPSLKILNYQKDSAILKEFLKPAPSIYDDDDFDDEEFE